MTPAKLLATRGGASGIGTGLAISLYPEQFFWDSLPRILSCAVSSGFEVRAILPTGGPENPRWNRGRRPPETFTGD